MAGHREDASFQDLYGYGMKVLITGGGGDVGIALAERLVSSMHHVVVYDLKGDGLPPGVRFVEGDVRDFSRLAEAAEGCDAGIHLAVLAGESGAEDIMSVNLLGAYGFLRAGQRASFRNSIVVSSAPVHLAPSESDIGFPLRTSVGRDHVYDLTKAVQELMAMDFHSHGQPVLCLRLGHIVLGEAGTSLERSVSLWDEDYCRGGWVALEDVVDACASALELTPALDTFEILNIVGAAEARERFHVGSAESRLGIKLRYDFAEYEEGIRRSVPGGGLEPDWGP